MTNLIDHPLAVTAVGAVSAAGATAAQTAASIRAGLSGFREHAFYESLSHDPEWVPGEPLLAAAWPGVDPALVGPSRLLELAAPALAEAGDRAALKRADLADSALLLALPDPDPDVAGWPLGDDFADALLGVTGLTGFSHRVTNQSGHTGAFELLRDAHDLLVNGRHRFCWIVGVDSFLCPDRLETWDADWRLRSERNADGFIPGEAACALLLELPAHAEQRGAPVRARVEALSMAEEPQPLTGDRVSTGRGLCEALAAVVPDGRGAGWVACDLNGESYRAFEWGLARARLSDRLADVSILEHPADCVGDVGAATGALLIAYVTERYARPRAPRQEAVLWCANDGSNRSAVRLSPPMSEGPTP